MIWNTETQRLEFEDGTVVGARPLNVALVAHGEPAASEHLEVTAECVERSASTYAMGKSAVKRLLKLNGTLKRKDHNKRWLRGQSLGQSHNADYLIPGVFYSGGYED